MDIVDDLRDLNSMHTPKEVSDIGEKAADEIERLRQQNAELVEEINKLKQAKEINKYASYPDDGFGGYPSVYNRR